MDFLNSWHNT